MAGEIRIKGLKEFRAKLKALDKGAPKQLRLAGNAAAGIVVNTAKPTVPVLKGRAKASIRAASTQSAARVRGGGARAPYLPWLEFGGRVGRNNSVKRTRVKEGRYIWPGYIRRREEVRNELRDALERAARSAGLEPR